MRYISLHFTWRILEHERRREGAHAAKDEPIKASAEERVVHLWVHPSGKYVILAIETRFRVLGERTNVSRKMV